MNRVLFSSLSEHWATPVDVYAALNAEFGFTMDACPLHEDREILGLLASWEGQHVYCNPPYGPQIRKWLEKASEADVAVYLVPARTDTRWWHDLAMKADEIRFLKGRLRFGYSTNNAPFPSVVLVYRKPAVLDEPR